MTPKDGLDCLGQFDLLGIFALFWYTLGFEVPRYVLAVLAVALTRLRPATALTVEWRPSGLVSIVVADVHLIAHKIACLIVAHTVPCHGLFGQRSEVVNADIARFGLH